MWECSTSTVQADESPNEIKSMNLTLPWQYMYSHGGGEWGRGLRIVPVKCSSIPPSSSSSFPPSYRSCRITQVWTSDDPHTDIMDFHDPNQVLLVIIIGWICGIQRMDGRAHGSFKNIYKLYHSLKKTKKKYCRNQLWLLPLAAIYAYKETNIQERKRGNEMTRWLNNWNERFQIRYHQMTNSYPNMYTKSKCYTTDKLQTLIFKNFSRNKGKCFPNDG